MTSVIDRPVAGPLLDAREFRDALGTFPTGVAVIATVDAQSAPVGLTCNSFSSVSLDPPLVLWSLRKASKSLEVFRRTPCFTINVLADDQHEFSGRFASSKVADKFDGVGWWPGYGGAPVIEGSLAHFECATFAVHEAGDHLIFIGEVQRFGHGRQQEPLVFYKGAYMMLTQSLRDLVAKGRTSPQHIHDARGRVYAVLLRLACENGNDADFDVIETHLARLEAFTAAADIERRMQAGVDFFRLVAVAAHNEVLSLVAESLNTLLTHALQAQIVQARQMHPSADLVNAAVVPLRRRLLERLRARDADGAEAALEEFLGHSSLLKSVEALIR
ncbi:MAG: flavin reductase [Variovorax sp.]|nr:flavin reductase [Variovorax sp.]